MKRTVLVLLLLEVAGVPQESRPRADHAVTFLRDIAPILDRRGCSSAGCHGKNGGAGGFQLSLLTLAPEEDHDPIVKGSGGRRIDFKDPENSRFLVKPTGGDGHKGGTRFKEGSPEYRAILAWIKAGAPFRPEDPRLEDVRVEPGRTVAKVGSEIALRVTATWSDGLEQDVTRMAIFSSSDEPVATVSSDGLVRGLRWGATSIQVRFLGSARAAFVAFPRPGEGTSSSESDSPSNFVDECVFSNLRNLNVRPSEISPDGQFCRRVYLDTLGILPTPAELSKFIGDPNPQKRTRLIGELLDRPEYVDLQTLRLADLLRLNPGKAKDDVGFGMRSIVLFHDWLREAVRTNKPYDHVVRDILLARGKELENGPANFWTIEKQPQDRAETAAQVFLGVRLMCARCHKHPFDRWTTDDYWDFSAIFAKIQLRSSRRGFQQSIVEYDAEAMLKNESVTGARRGQTARPALLGMRPLPAEEFQDDVIRRLADWTVSPENPYFARATMNRLWYTYFGRGLIMPVDDIRETSPEYVPGLLDALAKEFRRRKYDVKAMTKLLLNSRVYQLSAKPNPSNLLDDRFFSRSHARPLSAQVMLDIINNATGIDERFVGHGSPVGNGDFGVTRFVQFPVPHTGNYFLQVFGASRRMVLADVCPKLEPSVSQALHLMNSSYVNRKISDGKFVRDMLDPQLTERAIIEATYLRTLCRLPSDAEISLAVDLRKNSADRRMWVEDLLWGLLTCREFLFNS
jgi:hypothetical protein